jgi:hypothetical protein
MILTQHSGSSDYATCAIHEAERTPIPIVAQGSPLDFDEPVEINFKRRFLSCGGHHISLAADLTAEAFLNAGVFRIKGWGVQFGLYDENRFNIDRVLLRKFLDLYSKAEAGCLKDDERNQWISISTLVDYQRFCAERSPEVYVEGTLLGREQDAWRVRWHDGTEQRIDIVVGRPLEIIDVGQRFGAMIRMGKGNTIVSVTNISFVAEPAATSEELWQSWPTVNS